MLLRRIRPAAEVVEVAQLGDVTKAVARHGTPEVLCLDLKLPDTSDVSGVHALKAQFPDVPLAVISATPAADIEELCRDAGADIYIEKSAGATEMAAALRAIVLADASFEEVDGADAKTPAKLSKRQKQLVVMLDEGLSNRDIAHSLGISEHTVKVHLWRLFRRLGVKSRTQTIHFARANGLLGH